MNLSFWPFLWFGLPGATPELRGPLGLGQQLFNFQSPAVHWMARTSSLNCLSCRNPDQTPHSLNPSPLFTENPFFFTEKCFVGSPAQKSALTKRCTVFFWKWSLWLWLGRPGEKAVAVPKIPCWKGFPSIFRDHLKVLKPVTLNQQTRVYPYPLGAGSARPNPKMGAPHPENPLFLGFSVLRGVRDHGLGRSQTMG